MSSAAPGAASHAHPGCPVCGLAVDGREQCAECLWRLSAPLRLGRISADELAGFAAELEQAQHEHDVRFAALVTADPHRLAALIRGGPPGQAEWSAARRAAARRAAGALTEASLRDRLATAIATAPAGQDSWFVEVDERGIGSARLSVDEFGSPRLDRPEPARPWPELIPALSRDASERSLQLAGRFGTLDRDALWDALASAMRAVEHDGALVLVCPPGLLVLDRAAELIAARTGGTLLAAEPDAALSALIEQATTTAPLRRGYGLMVAVADPRTLAVRTELRPLFFPGDRPGHEVSVTARRAPGDHGDVTLAIFARDTSGTAEPQRPMLTVTIPPPAADYRVKVVLDGPGRPRITEPTAAKRRPEPWPEVLARIPARLEAAAAPVDLICAVDLAGEDDAVAARRLLIRDLLDLLEKEYPGPELLRVGMVGCTDHVFDPRRERDRVIDGVPLGPVRTARAKLIDMDARYVDYPPAAPVEDLLKAAATMLARSRDQDRRARLLLVGQRGPHPYRQGAGLPIPCPLHYDWTRSLGELVGGCGAICLAVTDTEPGGDQARIWRLLGRAGLPRQTGAEVRELGARLGMLPTGRQHIPIPLLFAK